MGQLLQLRKLAELATEEFKHELWSRGLVSEDCPIVVKNQVCKTISQVGTNLYSIYSTINIMYKSEVIIVSISQNIEECLSRFKNQFQYWYI